MTIEAEILQAIYQTRTPLITYFFQSVTVLGGTVFAALFLIGLYLVNEKELARKTFLAGAVTTVATLTLKTIFGRPRPDIEQQIGQQVLDLSFPSGHTAGAFALATVLAWRKPEARPYFYILAALVGVSRIYLGLHYPSDIIAGAVVGVLSAFIVIRREDIIEWFQNLRK